MSLAKDAEWLKARTIHIKGIPHEDRTGNGLRQVLESFLEKNGGMVVAVAIVPPFSKIFELETEMRDIKYLNMLLTATERHFFCCAPSNNSTEEKLLELEDKLSDEALKPFVPSGHAFVTFDSSVAADACVKQFQIGPSEYLRYFYQSLKNKLCSCFSGGSNRQRTTGSTFTTFIRFEDIDDLDLKTKYEEAVLSVRKATEPNDILW